ncbi:MAG: benzoate/H(+) symporter BenE family transporter [Alphaproteobacteria bacterium]|nr:benzoate/H(+) symporter BenE family transporter [Alphaproteobacteria bacterium]
MSPRQPMPAPAPFLRALDRVTVANAVVSFLFAVTGPFALLLAVGAKLGATPAQIQGWLLAGYAIGGLISVGASIGFRQPIAIAFSIPGAAILTQTTLPLPLPEIAGATVATGALLILLGATRLVGVLTLAVPLPVAMGMVAGIFVPFALPLVTALPHVPGPWVCAVAGYLAATIIRPIGQVVPPMVMAIIGVGAAYAFQHLMQMSSGVVTISVPGPIGPTGPASPALDFVLPTLDLGEIVLPQFTWRAIAELVPPMLVAVAAILNLQGFALMRHRGYAPPINAATALCGVGSLANAAFGFVPHNVTGPATGLLVQGGRIERHWAGGVLWGVLMTAFGLLAPSVTDLALRLPPPLIAMLGALALMPVLLGALRTAFGGAQPLPALLAFLVTSAGVPFLSVGAAFWGLLAGLIAHGVLRLQAGIDARPPRP